MAWPGSRRERRPEVVMETAAAVAAAAAAEVMEGRAAAKAMTAVTEVMAATVACASFSAAVVGSRCERKMPKRRVICAYTHKHPQACTHMHARMSSPSVGCSVPSYSYGSLRRPRAGYAASDTEEQRRRRSCRSCCRSTLLPELAGVAHAAASSASAYNDRVLCLEWYSVDRCSFLGPCNIQHHQREHAVAEAAAVAEATTETQG